MIKTTILALTAAANLTMAAHANPPGNHHATQIAIAPSLHYDGASDIVILREDGTVWIVKLDVRFSADSPKQIPVPQN